MYDNSCQSKTRVYTQLCQQKLKKLQDQEFSFNIMCILLNSLEGYSLDKKEKRKYGGYDHFNSVETKDKLQMKKQLIFHLRRMKDSYELYTQDHGHYDFPKKMRKEEIISDVKKWASKVPIEDKKYYFAFIDLINGEKIPDFKEDLYSIPSIAQKEENHAYNLMEGMVKISYYAGEKEKKIKEEYENKGYHEFEPILYGKPQSDPYLNKIKTALNKQDNKINFETDEMDKEELQKEVILGEKGKLKLYNNNLYFQGSKSNSTTIINSLDWKTIKNNSFYNISKGIIYVNRINLDGTGTCVLFNPNKVKKINEKMIKIEGTLKTDNSSYNYGIIEENGDKIDILVDLNEIL